MAPVTKPLRDEHRRLAPRVERLRRTADLVGETTVDALRGALDEAYVFLTEHFIPRADVEDRGLYPTIQKVMGAPLGTATMSRDHVEIGRLTQQLAALRARLSGESVSSADAKALRRVLYGLYALVMLHVAKEEEIYFPLLDRELTASEGATLLESMESAAKRGRAA